MTSQLVLVHEDERTLLSVASSLSCLGFNVFACHDIDAAHAILDHEHISALVLSPDIGTSISHWNKRIINHLRSYHPQITIIYADFNNESTLHEIVTEQTSQQLPSQENGVLYNFKPLSYFISSECLSTVFQPIVELANFENSFCCLGVESLARIQWPHLSQTINPEILFSYASNSGSLFELDFQCLKNAFAATSDEQKHLLFVNISPLTLIHPDFIGRIQEIKRPQCQVVLELTEHDSLPNLAALTSAAKRVRNLGFKLAIDDFGEGWANLNLLSALNPEYLKISGLFSKNLNNDSRKQAVLRSIAQLAHELNTQLILENVDSIECARAAQKLNIHFAQGYYFGKPN